MVSMNLSVIWNFRDSLRSIFSTIGVLVSHAKGVGWGISHTVNRMHPLKVLLSRCGKFMFLVKVHMNCPLRNAHVLSIRTTGQVPLQSAMKKPASDENERMWISS